MLFSIALILKALTFLVIILIVLTLGYQDGDGLKAVPADFFVTVLDVQDTPPIFINLPYAQRVFENITAVSMP